MEIVRWTDLGYGPRACLQCFYAPRRLSAPFGASSVIAKPGSAATSELHHVQILVNGNSIDQY
eukprot:scaffold47336_cov30-Tisochrysis_lutea.AAC.2